MNNVSQTTCEARREKEREKQRGEGQVEAGRDDEETSQVVASRGGDSSRLLVQHSQHSLQTIHLCRQQLTVPEQEAARVSGR